MQKWKKELFMTIKAKTEILPEAQKILWPLLAEVPGDFVLYGGTAMGQ